jgi:malate dehydrogenase (oxaloacetate-decarboxylating)
MADAICGADVFIGVSEANILNKGHLLTMAPHSIIFALSNPDPEITAADAQASGVVAIYASGRSGEPNQINNVVAFPGIFRGILDCRARLVSPEMKMSAAVEIAKLTREGGLRPDRIIVDPQDSRLCGRVSGAVMKTARAQKLARL